MQQHDIESVSLAVRSLSMDAVEQANSGHPGLPLGCAEIGAMLFGELMRYHPDDPVWVNRDRFVLSAGHGSMLLYSLLYLSGFDLSLDEIKNFRQLGSKTPGHPEYGHTPGVETTTGPLGQGFGNAVGMAIAEAFLAEHFNTEKHKVVDHLTYVIAGDGDMMEGISNEAASIAGHLGLGKLIVYYDSNRITIDGATDISISEDVGARFEALGWHVQKSGGYDSEEIRTCTEAAQAETEKPSLIILDTLIGKGAPNKQGTHGVHGAPLGLDEIEETKNVLGIPKDENFFVPEEVYEFFAVRKEELEAEYEKWLVLFEDWSEEHPSLRHEWDRFFSAPDLTHFAEPEFAIGESIATRKAGGKVLNSLAEALPNLIGGSADLASSNKTLLEKGGSFSAKNRRGRNIHYGVREHAMAAITNGIALHGGLLPFASTFLIFSDYLRPSLRLSALMKLPVIYVFTHDSPWIGEDGPTHQPVEQLPGLRSVPGLQVLRPADAQETAAAWRFAVNYRLGPVALVLSRQGLPVIEKGSVDMDKALEEGAYVVLEPDTKPEAVVFASGSEVSAALEAAENTEKAVRVVSVINRERAKQGGVLLGLIPEGAESFVIEAAMPLGWDGIAPRDHIIGIERFGASAPGAHVIQELGVTSDALIKLLES
ncbi:MAG: transketolase [Spirochaetia bacterium]